MQQDAKNWFLTAEQEARYLCSCIEQYQKYYRDIVNIQLHTDIGTSGHRIEHDLLWPLIDDALRAGVFGTIDRSIIFNLQLTSNCLAFSVQYTYNLKKRDERTMVTYLRFKKELEDLYPDRHILYRDYYEDSYLVLLKLQLK